MFRIGNGYDIHKYGGNKPLKIGGVEVDHSTGVIAHSDGDVLLHSVSDALLGALALGDIGTFFPDTDPAYKGMDSKKILAQCIAMAKTEKYILSNLDCTIIAQTPKLSNYILQIRYELSCMFDVDINCIGVKATTNEGLDSIGNNQAIAVLSTVLLKKIDN